MVELKRGNENMKKNKGLLVIFILIVLVVGTQLAQGMWNNRQGNTKHLNIGKSIEVTKTEYYHSINDDEVPKTLEATEEREGIIYSGVLDLETKYYNSLDNSWKAVYGGKLYYDKDLNKTDRKKK